MPRISLLDFGATLITDLILQEADVIVNENPLIDEILLENKLVLSIAIRLQAEQLILKLINDIDTVEILSNQTRGVDRQNKTIGCSES